MFRAWPIKKGYCSWVRALGMDVGSRTIGLALSDSGRMLATAWETIRRQGQKLDARDVLERAAAQEVNHFVVGWPLELDGSVGHRARRVQVFVDAVKAQIDERELGIEIDLWDERFSTAAAERALIEADVSRKKRKGKIDAVAAQMILQGWLDAQVKRGEGEGPA
jgi:putative Holliday junction resolvase